MHEKAASPRSWVAVLLRVNSLLMPLLLLLRSSSGVEEPPRHTSRSETVIASDSHRRVAEKPTEGSAAEHEGLISTSSAPAPWRPWVSCRDPAGPCGHWTGTLRTPQPTRERTPPASARIWALRPPPKAHVWTLGAEFLLWHPTRNKEPRCLLKGLQPPEWRLWEECLRHVRNGSPAGEAAV